MMTQRRRIVERERAKQRERIREWRSEVVARALAYDSIARGNRKRRVVRARRAGASESNGQMRLPL